LAALALAGCLAAGAASAGENGTLHFGYGTTATPAQIAGWAIAVRPDGQGLPPGKGSVSAGSDLFQTVCAACHGTFGEGETRYPKLAGNGALTGDRPDPSVGNYWPYATTVFDYVNRAMPFPTPHSLTPDQVYAVTAYILNLNNIVPDSFVADATTLPQVKMPNRDGFIWTDPRPDTHDTECMKDCLKADQVAITSTAEGKGITPRTTGPLDTSMPQ
jgi:cytochrome c